MKLFKVIFQIIKWVIIIGILLFSLALALNKSYLQTLLFLLIAVALIWWPKIIMTKWNKNVALISRFSFLILLILIKVIFLKNEPKTSIYTSKENQEKLMRIYYEKVTDWPVKTEDIFIETIFGKVHILA